MEQTPTDPQVAVEPVIVEAPVVTEPVATELAGVPDGTVIGEEQVVYEYDTDGTTVIGWHKEEVTNG